LKNASSMVSSLSKLHIRARMLDTGLYAARPSGVPSSAMTSTVSPGRARPSSRATALSNNHGWRRSSERSRSGFRISLAIGVLSAWVNTVRRNLRGSSPCLPQGEDASSDYTSRSPACIPVVRSSGFASIGTSPNMVGKSGIFLPQSHRAHRGRLFFKHTFEPRVTRFTMPSVANLPWFSYVHIFHAHTTISIESVMPHVQKQNCNKPFVCSVLPWQVILFTHSNE
jgi:hypothetical protein